MAAPLIYAAGAVVAKFIAQKGVAAAAKKFTKRAVAQGQKHIKDLKTKPTAGQSKVEKATRGQRASRKSQRIGFGVGAVTAAGSSALIGKGAGISSQKTKLKELRKKLKEQKNATNRAKVQAQIEKMVAQEAESKKLGNTSTQPKARPLGITSAKPKLRKKK